MKKFLSVFVVVLFAVSGFGQKKQTSAKKTDTTAKKAISGQKKQATAKKTDTTAKKAVSGSAQKKQISARKPDTTAKRAVSKPDPVPTPTPVDPAAEKAKLDEALALPTAAERTKALQHFIGEFPISEHRLRASESLVSARAILADEKLQAGENAEAGALFKLAVDEAPTPIPERLFNEIVSKFPANLFYREQRAAGIEIAAAIEKKAAGNAKQLVNLASFYLGIESGSDSKRLAEAAIAADPNSVTAHQTLGLAHRLDFDLEESAKAYSKALELDPGSVASKRNLAEMKRALGKPDEATILYREIVAANENDAAANTGLILSLFGAGKRTDAEAEMQKALKQNPKNLNLLSGAAYWYAANNLNDNAVELGQKAVELEPRYIWGHIALARGLMGQNKPVEAERVLVMARQYGNFPTLEYEIASARLQTGFYREAVEELQKSFSVRDGLVQTRLGRRIPREAGSLADLIAYERKASIFEPVAADHAESSKKLKLLLEITEKLTSDPQNETELATLTDEFVKGADKMKLHRQMYSATLLLQKNVILPKVLELVKAAVGNADAGLEVSTPAAAVMASELYESRTIAFSRNEMIVVPEVPRQTLSAILRGRIEELTGWTLYQQKSYPEAIVRLRRAISVLPEKSAWWRSSMWRLGSALEAEGKDKEALESYVSSYKTDRPNVYKYAVVEASYRKVHGNTEGLEALIGPNPLPPVVATEPSAKPEPKGEAANIATAAVPSGAPAETQTKQSEPLPNNSLTEKPSDLPQLPTEIPAKTSADDQVKRSEAGKPNDQPAVVASTTPEVPKIDTDQSRPKPEDLKASVETGEPKTVVPEIKKAESPIVVRPVAEPIQNAKSEPSKQEPGLQTAVPVKEKEVTSGSAPEPEKPKTDESAKTDRPTEPKNLLRDPFVTIEKDQPKSTAEKTEASDRPDQTAADNSKSEKPTSNPKTPVVTVTDPIGKEKAAATTKDLFEPVVINVQSAKPQISAKPENEKRTENGADTSKGELAKIPETAAKPADGEPLSGATRVRVVDGKEIKADSQCSLELSHDTISLLNGGGSLGVAATVEGEAGFDDMSVTSSSPSDVVVRAEPEIEGITGRRFYVIKSVSMKTGLFQVVFESKCGKKEIVVRVR